jgi:hypothetical protein
MRLGYSIPRDWSYSISGGAWASGDAGNPAYLCDRAPQERTYFTWPAGAQTTSTTCSITATRVASFVPGLACLLNTSLPLGTLVKLYGRRVGDAGYTYALGGNTQTARVVALPDGGRGIIWVPATGLDAIYAFQVQAFNDVFGAAVITAEALHSIGEVNVMPASVIDHETGPTERWSELRATWTLGSQAHLSGRTPQRSVTVRSCPMTYAEARDEGLANDMDWQTLAGLIARDPAVLAVLYDSSSDLAQRSAVFGVATGVGMTGLPGRYQQTETLTITEAPSG